MPALHINGIALHYRELGNPDRRTIIFAPSVLWGSEVFDALISECANEFHCIVVDIHGHGQSGYRTPMTLEEMMEDYYQLITRLNLTNVTWIGFSIGGMIGLRMALAHPRAINSLILIAATAQPDPPQLREQTWKLWEMFRDGHRNDIVEPALQFFFAPATYTHQPELVEQYRKKLIAFQDVKGMFEAARAAFERQDISKEIRAINVPVLAIAGKEDRVQSPEESEHIVSHIPNARLAVIKDASHMFVVEKPHEVAKLVREFLN